MLRVAICKPPHTDWSYLCAWKKTKVERYQNSRSLSLINELPDAPRTEGSCGVEKVLFFIAIFAPGKAKMEQGLQEILLNEA